MTRHQFWKLRIGVEMHYSVFKIERARLRDALFLIQQDTHAQPQTFSLGTLWLGFLVAPRGVNPRSLCEPVLLFPKRTNCSVLARASLCIGLVGTVVRKFRKK